MLETAHEGQFFVAIAIDLLWFQSFFLWKLLMKSLQVLAANEGFDSFNPSFPGNYS